MPDDRDRLWFIRGRLTVEETGAPIPHLLVRAWDKDFMFDDALGECTTDHDGRFFVQYRTRDFDDGGLESRPDLYLQVHIPESDRLIYSSDDAIRRNAGRLEQFEVQISHWSFNIADGPAFMRFRPQVHGQVIDHDGRGMGGLKVRVHDAADGRILTSELTNYEGNFEAWYPEPHGPLALRISVLRVDGTPVYESREPLEFDGTTPVVHQVRLRSR